MSAPGDLIDWAGVTHVPAVMPVRIACLVPSLTELLFALGLGPTMVARTGFCIHPSPAVRQVPKIGGTKDPDLVRLQVLAPTHLIVNVDENRREVVDAARAFVPQIVVTHPSGPLDNQRLFALFGAIFDRADEAANMTKTLNAALADAMATTAALPRERVLYLIWKEPWMTVTRDTYVGATLATVGLDVVPAAAASRYPVVNDGDAVWRDAERILLSTEPYAFRERDRQALATATGKSVALVDGEWTSWYGVRAAPGLRALADWRMQLPPSELPPTELPPTP
ncbi:MAG: helical backbone metal receptor [Betaproteobacteria bacterium]